MWCVYVMRDGMCVSIMYVVNARLTSSRTSNARFVIYLFVM